MTEETKTDEESLEESIAREANKPKESASVEAKGEGPNFGELSGAEQMPPPDFSSFIFSISTTVLMDLGEIEHPIDKEKKENLNMAKHSIDLLDMMKEKTKGNLTKPEGVLLDNIVADLKLRYCKKTT